MKATRDVHGQLFGVTLLGPAAVVAVQQAAEGLGPGPVPGDGDGAVRDAVAVGRVDEEFEEAVGEGGGVGVLVDAPESVELLVEFAEGCYDALALDKY